MNTSTRSMTNQVKPMNRGLFRNPTGLLWWVAIAVAAIPISAQADAVPLFDGKTFAGWEGDTNKLKYNWKRLRRCHRKT